MKMKMKTKLLLAIATCALPLVYTTHADDTNSSTVTAPEMESVPNPDGLRLAITVPGWLIGINGDVTALGHQQNVDISYSDLQDHLQCSAGAALDLGYGKFDFYTDVGYMKFTGNAFGPGFSSVSQDLKFVLGNAGLAYQLVNVGDEQRFVLAGTAGLRYWYLDNSITIVGPGGALLFSGSHNKDLIQPDIGLRGSQYLTRKLHLDFSTDIGGFGLQHANDLTWSATGMFTYDLARWLSISAGYKGLGLVESEDGNRGKNGVNVIFSGVLIAATVKF